MLKHRIRSLRPPTCPPSRRPCRRSRPRLEVLEDRTVPAGLIDVTFVNGVLTVGGDADANTLTVHQNADGRLTLTTDIGTGLRVNGTTVSGFVGHTLSAPVTGGVTINLGDGFDSLTITGLVADVDLPASLSINGGAGNNLVTVQQGVTVGGDLSITNGVGFDTTHLFDEVTVLGRLTIRNGEGGSLLDGNATTDLRVSRTLTVASGAGLDTLDWSDAQHVSAGGFVLKTGADADGSTTDLSPVQSLTITGAVAVTNGAGPDTLNIGDPTLVTRITGGVVIANGAGTNHTDLFGTDRLDVGGPIAVTGGAASDFVHLGVNSNLVSLGSVTVGGRSGLNETILSGTALSVAGNLTVSGGAGPDNVHILCALDGLITGAVKLSLGAGQNRLEARAGNDATLAIGGALTFLSTSLAGSLNSVDLSDLRVQGGTVITTGGGDDLIGIDDAAFNGSFSLNTAGGTDTVNVEQTATLAGQTRFNRAVMVQVGAGNDAVKVSGILAEPGRKTIFSSTARFDGGADADTLVLSAIANLFFGPPPVTTGF